MPGCHRSCTRACQTRSSRRFWPAYRARTSGRSWTYSFSDPRNLARRVPSRILSVLDAWLRRARAGVALDALMRFYREANDSLMERYQAQADAQVDDMPDPTDPAERAQLWMLRNDLRGYVLLGDPAARL